jgi:hypothetical protein
MSTKSAMVSVYAGECVVLECIVLTSDDACTTLLFGEIVRWGALEIKGTGLKISEETTQVYSLTPALPHSLPHSLTPSLTHHSLTPSLTHHSLTHSLTTHSLTHHSLSHSATHYSLTHPDGILAATHGEIVAHRAFVAIGGAAIVARWPRKHKQGVSMAGGG